MAVFTYHKKAAALRSFRNMLIAVVAFEGIFWAILIPLLPRPWNWIVLGAFLVLIIVVVPMALRIYRTRFVLNDESLRLGFGQFRLDVPRELIASVSLDQGSLPRGVDPGFGATPVYHPENDTLYLLPDKQRRIRIALAAPLSTRIAWGRPLVEFTQIVLVVDEPERFLAAFGSASAPVLAEVGATPTVPFKPVSAVGAGTAVRLEGLVKRYGDFTAVQGLNLTVEPGEVVGFLGSNGAGKTTTIKMMTGLLRPTAGRVLIAGRDVWAEGPQARRLLGYVPDVPLLHEQLTAREFLWLMAGLYDMEKAEGRRRADELLQMLGLERFADHQIRGFSLGMKRKMAIAAALLHRPQVLLLDEVTNGLDPRAARDIKDYVAAAARAGTAVLLATHVLEVAQELAHRIAVIDRGVLRALGTLEELRVQAGRPGANLEEIFLALTANPEVSA